MKKTGSEQVTPAEPLERARLQAEVAKQRVRIAKEELKRAPRAKRRPVARRAAAAQRAPPKRTVRGARSATTGRAVTPADQAT